MPRAPLSPTSVRSPRRLDGQPLSVADVIRWARRSDLPEAQSKRLVSDIGCIAKMIGLPPESVLLTPDELRRTLFSTSPAGYAISVKRMRNILSTLRFVLCLADVIDAVNTPVSTAWLKLLDLLTIRKRAEMIGFARFCSQRQVQPLEVSTEILQAFEIQVTERTLTPRPKKRIGALRSFWNLCSSRIPGWPAVHLEGGRKHDYILSLEAFPPEFGADLARFGHRLTASAFDAEEEFEGGQVDATGAEEGDNHPSGRLSRAKPVKSITRDLRLSHARWAASAAVASGILPLSAITCVRDLVTPLDRPKAILKFLYDRAGKKPSAGGMHVADVLRIIARHDARLSEMEVARIMRWGHAVRLHYSGMTERNERTVRKASAPDVEARLLVLPEVLMLKATKLLESSPRAAVSVALRATVVELIDKTPLRSSEILKLRLDQHLQRPDPRRNRISHLSLQASERKAPVPYSVSISTETSDILELWIRKFRPIIAAPDCLYLFPSFAGGNRPMSRQGLREALVKATGQNVGVELTTHVFRHLAGHRFLEEFPGRYGAVSRLLGHKDPATAERFYLSKENEAAHRQYDAVVLKRKRLHRANDCKPRPGKKGDR